MSYPNRRQKSLELVHANGEPKVVLEGEYKIIVTVPAGTKWGEVTEKVKEIWANMPHPKGPKTTQTLRLFSVWQDGEKVDPEAEAIAASSYQVNMLSLEKTEGGGCCTVA